MLYQVLSADSPERLDVERAVAAVRGQAVSTASGLVDPHRRREELLAELDRTVAKRGFDVPAYLGSIITALEIDIGALKQEFDSLEPGAARRLLPGRITFIGEMITALLDRRDQMAARIRFATVSRSQARSGISAFDCKVYEWRSAVQSAIPSTSRSSGRAERQP